MNYNYVFLTNELEDIKIMFSGFDVFSDGRKKEDSELFSLSRSDFKRSFFEKCLFTNKNIFSKLNKKLFYSSFIKKNLKKTLKLRNTYKKNICFVIYARLYQHLGKPLLDYLHKVYNNCVCVCYLGDLIESHKFTLENLRRDFKYIFSFDKEECKKYNFRYVERPFTFLQHDALPIKYDVTFVGRAKDRFPEILQIYDLLHEKGFRCDFNIIDVEKENQKYPDSITYNKFMNFNEVLTHVLESNCILEVMQKGAFSPSARYSEAMLYKKYLITNCDAFKLKDELPPNIIYYDSPKNIDFNRLKKKLEFDNYKYVKSLSVETMINAIENQLYNTKIETN